MAGQEVGVAYISLLPSGKGFGKAVEQDIDQAYASSEKKSQGLFSKLGGFVKGVGLAVAGVATAVGAIAIGGGISRALNIEDAQAKLRGLGNDTQTVQAIMQDALSSVEGTAFGLGSAATVAASAVAAGIKPGEELRAVLKTIANSAAAAGTSMEDMGSIFNKVASTGRAYTEDIQRIADRGLPIWQKLAESMGVTTDEVRKLASEGKIGFQQFADAATAASGTVADEMGNTTRGMLSNTLAALSRLGEVFVGPGLEYLRQFLREAIITVNGLKARVQPVVARFTEWLTQNLSMEGLGERALAGIDKLVQFFKTGFGAQLFAAIQPILPLLAEVSRQLGPVLGSALRELFAALEPVIPLLSVALVDAVRELAPSLTELLSALIPLIPELVTLAVELLPLLVDVLRALIPVLVQTAQMWASFAAVYAGMVGILKGDRTFEELQMKILGAAGPIGDLARAFYAAGESIAGAVEWVRTLVGGLVQFLQDSWAAFGLTLGDTLRLIVGLFTGNFTMVEQAVVNIVQRIVGVAAAGMSVFAASFSGGVDSAVSVVQSLPSRIMAVFANAGSWLVQAGRDIIRGLIAGVQQMAVDAVAAVKNVGGSMVSGVKDFLGIQSPSRVFRDEVGRMIGAGLVAGVNLEKPAVDSAVAGLVSVPSFAGVASGSSLPESVRLQVGEREFTAYVGEVSDGRIGQFDQRQKVDSRPDTGWR